MNKLKIAAEWAVCIADLVLGMAFILLAFSTLSNLSKSQIIQKKATSDYVLDELEREDYGSAGMISRRRPLGAKIDEPMQEFYMVGSYADLMFWEKIYAESGSELTAMDCRQQCEKIKNALPEYEKVYKKIDDTLEKATAKEGS